MVITSSFPCSTKVEMFMKMYGRFLFAAVLGCLSLQAVVYAQDQSGFISLDCGSPRDSKYTETSTGINYISDSAFINTGTGKQIDSQFQANIPPKYWYLRSFPEGIRNCYNFNLTKGNKYLIRAYFLYGNYDGQDNLPTFDIHIGPNRWESVTLGSALVEVNRGIIHVLSSSCLNLCLVNTGSGTPFISTLEIRLLKSTIYNTQSGSLNDFARFDIGPTTNTTVRYKDDVYDRIWYPHGNDDNWTSISTSLTVNSLSDKDYQPPSRIMQSAATPKDPSKSLHFWLETNDDNTLTFYVYLHFAEIQRLQANESRQFNISLNGQHWFGPVRPLYLSSTTSFSPTALSGGKYTFSIYKTESSTHPPILNAIEVFSVKELLRTQTDQNDVDAIINIKSIYGVERNWEGDPCGPPIYMWGGLNCSDDGSNPPKITSLDLSSSELEGEITPYFSNLTLLEYLDLSNNNLIGTVPDFLSQLPLKVLNLEGNRLTGSIPIGLLEKSKNGSLSLRVGRNPNLCSSASCGKKKGKIIVPVIASLAFIVAAFAFIYTFKMRRQQGSLGKAETESNINVDAIESNKRFSYSEILKITQNFEKILGKGGFGMVYYGCLDGMEVAVKMLSQSSTGFEECRAEVKRLMRVHHRNLVSFVGYCDEGDKMALIYEYMANGSLQEHLAGSSTSILTWEGRLQIAVESAQGLEYLHNCCMPPIIHRDVKSTNILLNDQFQAKLADFGLLNFLVAQGQTDVSTVASGTPGYLDPEYYVSNRLTEKSDIYSFGVVLLELITSKSAFVRINEHENTHLSQWVDSFLIKGDILNIVDSRLQGNFDTNSVWKAVEVAMACLCPSANRRPSMNVILMELNECLAMEIARIDNTGSGLDSNNWIILNMNPRPG